MALRRGAAVHRDAAAGDRSGVQQQGLSRPGLLMRAIMLLRDYDLVE